MHLIIVFIRRTHCEHALAVHPGSYIATAVRRAAAPELFGAPHTAQIYDIVLAERNSS